MNIELLWLVPIVAFMVFVLFIVLYFQRKTEYRIKGANLSREVDLFNAGHGQQKLVTAKFDDDRLHEMEKIINFVAEAVANQHKPFHEIKRESNDSTAASAGETRELKEKLRTVFREYDIILSENYTLRAKIKQITRQLQEREGLDSPITGSALPAFDSILTGNKTASKPSLKLYDDTRLINLANMDNDDLSESDDALAR
ncbi:MAG: hypothetical protein ABSF80_10165 [Chitinispirillaceae bacterium]|jgi:hypothetical protein